VPAAPDGVQAPKHDAHAARHGSAHRGRRHHWAGAAAAGHRRCEVLYRLVRPGAPTRSPLTGSGAPSAR